MVWFSLPEGSINATVTPLVEVQPAIIPFVGTNGFSEARTTYGVIGVKVWVYKGEILPAKKREQTTGVGAF